MSWINQAVLCAPYYRGDAIKQVNVDLARRDHRGQEFQPLDMDNAGGNKWFSGYVWAAAFNHVFPRDIKAAVASAEWPQPDRVVLILDGEAYQDHGEVATVTQLRKDLAEDEDWIAFQMEKGMSREEAERDAATFCFHFPD